MADESAASIHVNRSLGFTHVGTMREVGYKFGRVLDVHVMQLMLNASETSERVTMTCQDNVGTAVIESAIDVFRSNKNLADKAIAQSPDDKLHVALDPNTNSIAVIMKHIAGNLLSRWTDFLTTDGEKPWRNRDEEFVDSFGSRAELLDYWEKGWGCLFSALQSLNANDLPKTVTIRGEPHSVPLAIDRSLAHCGYHIGQIMLLSRILAGDQWETITIPRGGSAEYNRQTWGEGHDKITSREISEGDKQSP